MSEYKETEAAEKSNKRKRNIVVLSVFVGVALLLGVVLLLLLFPKHEPRPTQEELIQEFYEANKSYFATPDFERDPASDAAYMSRFDRTFYLKEGGATVTLTAASREDAPSLDTVCRLIEASMNGDAAAYNALFTDRYLTERGAQAAFTKQKLYNITVVAGGETNGVSYYTVRYSIKDNDGTLRRDVLSDTERDMVLSVRETENGFLIDTMSFRFLY